MKPTHLDIEADAQHGRVTPITVPAGAIDIERDSDHMRDALRGDRGAWGRMSKGRKRALQAMNEHEQKLLLEWLDDHGE